MGTNSISAETRSVTSTTSESQAGRFETLKRELDQAVQTRIAKGYWEDRAVESSFSEQFLAVSWRGSSAYWKALAWQKELDKLNKLSQALPTGVRTYPERDRDIACRALNDRFLPKETGPYALEAFVFFKTSNLAPAALTQMAPNCVQAFTEAPLHTYFLIYRQQAVVDKGEALRFGGFEPGSTGSRDAAGVREQLSKKIFPKEACVPKADPPKTCWPCYIFGGLALALIVATASVLAVPSSRDWAFGQLDIGRQSDIDGLGREVATLRDRYDMLAAELDRLAALSRIDPGSASQASGGTAGDAARITQLEAELAALASQLADRGHEVPDRGMPLGLAPCLPVVPTGSPNGGAPGYLYALTLGADGIRIVEPTGVFAWSAADRADPDFPAARPLPVGPVSVSDFEVFASPISRQARAANCAHYVLLREGEGGDRASYIGQRNAVERHFYLYRPHP